ncbi:MAG: hypothetical protein R3B06_19545 [Kofleriaceae bacterium]
MATRLGCAGALTLALAGSAAAQNADAEILFTDAVKLEAAGDLDKACDSFEGSNRIEPRAGTMVRLGQCREKQGRLVSAWSAYKDSLTRVKDPKKRKVAEDRVAALEPMLSYLTVSVPDDVRVDGLEVTRNGEVLDPALWNRAAPVDGGSYTIVGHAPGHEAWQTTVEVADAKDKVSVEVPRFKEIKKLVDPVDKPRVGPAPLVTGPTEAPSSLTGKRKLALGLAGVGLVAIGGGVAFGLQAKGFEDDAYALCPDPATPCADAARAQDLSDKSASRALLANIGYGVGGAAVIGAAVLWFTGGPSRSSDQVAVTPRLGSAFTGVTVRVGF